MLSEADEWAYAQELECREFYAMEAKIPKALIKFIQTRDKRHNSLYFSQKREMTDLFHNLLQGKKVIMGGRASCGGKADPSWVSFGYWNEIVRKANSLGYNIKITPRKQANAWATKAGGFWYENEYEMEKQ